MVEKINSTKIAIFLLIGAVLGGLYFTSIEDGFKRKERLIKSLDKELKKQKEEVAAANAVVADKSKFEEELNFVSDRLKAALEYLPTDLNAQDILRKLYSEAGTSGVKLVSVKPGKTQPYKFFDEIFIDVDLEGSFSQLTLFLSYISKLKRIVRVKNFRIRQKEFVDGTPVLSLKGTLAAYKYLEPKEGAPGVPSNNDKKGKRK